MRPHIATLLPSFLLLAFAIMSSAHAQTLSFRDILERPNRPAPDSVVKYGDAPDQYGELWLPKRRDPTTKSPVAVLVHGGCWRADLPGPELVAFLADAIRHEGVAVWSITYRRVGTKTGGAGFKPYPDTFLDVAKAADTLKTLAATHALDLDRIVATGHSAGGHLAFWLAARHRLPADSPLTRTEPLAVKAVVGIAAIPDLAVGKSMSAHACGADTVDLLIDAATRGTAALRDTSLVPLLPLGNRIKQTLVSGVYDAIVAPAQALRYRERAKAAGDVASLITLDDAGHFELIAPWTAAGKRVVAEVVGAAAN
jgi:acetyl esterase/lipase